ncbi:MAG TPA: DUF6498-containing protein [Burkholderiales bacterium]|nr:DUF6498-containing protein [Burkholderiales bacterium]
MVCPKCRYTRQPADIAPVWQCPSCGIAYVKYWAAVEKVRDGATQLVTPPKAGEPAREFQFDGSLWFLVVVNVLALGIAHVQQWPLKQLMLLYWAQSIVIGLSYVARISSLKKFSTDDFEINERPVDPTPATKWRVVAFFILHYGAFHAFYLIFFVGTTPGLQEVGPPRLDAWFWVCTAAFAANHLWSYRYNREIDRQGTPNIGTLMFTPYLRIVPMHLTILFAGLLGQGLLLFGALKTLADLGMHLIEHRQLKKVQSP